MEKEGLKLMMMKGKEDEWWKARKQCDVDVLVNERGLQPAHMR